MAEMASSGTTVEALESLYRACLPAFVRTAAAITGDEAAGSDAVQEAFAQAVNGFISDPARAAETGKAARQRVIDGRPR